MRLVRYGRLGAEKPGVIGADGKLRSLASVIDDITPEVTLLKFKPRKDAA